MAGLETLDSKGNVVKIRFLADRDTGDEAVFSDYIRKDAPFLAAPALSRGEVKPPCYHCGHRGQWSPTSAFEPAQDRKE